MKEEEKNEPGCVKIENGIAPSHGLVLFFVLIILFCYSLFLNKCYALLNKRECSILHSLLFYFIACNWATCIAVGIVIKMKF